MIISDVVLASGTAGFFYDDQQAIKKGAKSDGFTYVGLPITEGYKQIRQPAESISVMLILEDGQVAFGDCVSVQYSGVGGRDSLFIADDFIPFIREYIVPELKGKEITNFKDMAEKIDNLKIKGKKIHTAIRYGVTQAILDAVAKKNKITMAEVIKKEYDIDISFDRVPIYAQSGDERYSNVDKMVLKGVDVLPHGLINNVEEKVGKNGEILIIDFSEEFISNHIGGENEEKLTIESIVKTVTELTEINGIKIKINGEENKEFKNGKIKFNQIFNRDF